ncbi:MAG TPA: hypothetical protein VF367_05375 [Candidatus Limnocylindria bacterium]
MTRPGAIPRVIAAWMVAAVAGSLASPPPARAAEPEVVILPGRTAAALTSDVDGAGGREIVRLRDDDGAALQLEVWRERDGEWAASRPVDIPSPMADTPEQASYDLGAGLIVARLPGELVTLVVTGGTDPREFGPTTCCLTIHRLLFGGERPTLESIANPGIAVEEVFVLDFDDDAVDELVVGSSLFIEGREAPIRTYTALRWNGERYVVAGSQEVDGWQSGGTVADSDGLPGSELVVVEGDQRALVRLGLDRGLLAAERTDMIDGGSWLAGAIGSHLLMVGGRVALYDWPSGGELARGEEVGDGAGQVFGVVGAGADSLLVIQDSAASGSGFAVSIDVYDARLEHLARIEPTTDALALDELMLGTSQTGGWNLERSLWPYIGPTDWSNDARDAWIVAGHAVTSDASDGLHITPMALLGSMPVGHAGTADEWVAVCDGCWRERDRTYLYSEGVYGTGQLTLTPAAQLLSDSPIEAAVSHAGAMVVGSDPTTGITHLLGNAAGFELQVTAGPGVAVVSWDGSRLRDHGTDEGVIRIPVAGPDADAPPDDHPFERTLILIGPDGRFELRTWRGTFAPAAPTVTADMEMTVGSLDVEVSGTASALATVTVDGRPVPVAADGRFTTTISVAPWPAAIIVTATDPFGTAVERTVEVIGLVDYRGLPWGAMAIAATLGVAALLFLRVPHLRGAVTPVGDGTLEEIDADPR